MQAADLTVLSTILNDRECNISSGELQIPPLNIAVKPAQFPITFTSHIVGATYQVARYRILTLGWATRLVAPTSFRSGRFSSLFSVVEKYVL